MSDESVFTLTYQFDFPDGSSKVFDVQLLRKNCSLIQPSRDYYPEWTRLEYRKCRHCPLSATEHPRCPVAVSLIDVVEFFQDAQSVEEAVVTVNTRQRLTERGKTALYPAISSIIGIYMVTSGCPVMDKLRPMARFHLPFANTEETVYRALSMYALAQYFRQKRGLSVDLDFSGLQKIYQDVNRLNIDFSRRFRTESISEATMNALTSLDCFAQIIDFSISEEMLEEIEVLFEGYMD
ncbi:DUF6901 family protein [Coraliomargarita parva]|uniref:DUF6901 family protein n=1 Tax=Coraliomargarita parva TaxID=3014050 RepID=UPI0022B44BF5|nr:hypothetical protein [Coraliomargarita parva]